MNKDRPGVQRLWAKFDISYLEGASKTTQNYESGGQSIELIMKGDSYLYRPSYWGSDASSFKCDECSDVWIVILNGFALYYYDTLPKAKPASPPWIFGFPNPHNKDLLWFEFPDVDPFSETGITGIAEISFRGFRVGIRPRDGLIQYGSIVYRDSSGQDDAIVYSQVDKFEFGTVRPSNLRLPPEAAKADWTDVHGKNFPPPPDLFADN